MFGAEYQGDIKLNEIQKAVLVNNSSRNQTLRTGWTWEGFRWPTNDKGLVIVPYTIHYLQGFCMKQMIDFHEKIFMFQHFQHNEKSKE